MLGLRGIAEKKYRVSGATLDDSALCFFEKSIFFRSIKENPDLALNIIQFYAQELCNNELRQKAFTQFSIRERVAETLLMIKAKYGVETTKGIFLLDVPFTIRELADLVGASYEMVVRTLTQLKKENLVKVLKGKIILNDYIRLNSIIDKYAVAENTP